MSIKKYTDWSSWWSGLRTSLMKCLGTTGSIWITTNGAAATIPGAGKFGLDWHQAIGFFAVHLAIEAFSYIKENQPQVITETVDTTFTSKQPDGSKIEQSSTTTTTTPVK